jgi:uncharacterized membrane protein
MESAMPPRHETAAVPPDLSGSLLLFAVVAAGAAAMEAALVPGVLIGGAAWLAPKAMARLRGRNRKKTGATLRLAAPDTEPAVDRQQGGGSWKGLQLTTSAAKTVTFRVISSGLDFGWNYLLLGEVATAASLSGFSLVAAPTFYFLHETLWSRAWPSAAAGAQGQGIFRISSDIGGVKVSKAMAKTVTFRLFATVSEFSVNYFVVRDLLLATKLSAFSIVAGPFVYLAHERGWERFEASRRPGGARPSPRLLAAPTQQGV